MHHLLSKSFAVPGNTSSNTTQNPSDSQQCLGMVTKASLETTRPAASPDTAACTGEDMNVTCLVPCKCHSLMDMTQYRLYLDFAALMASLGFCSLPYAVLRGFQAWGCLSVGTLSSSRLEGEGPAGGSGSAWPWLWIVAMGCLCIPVAGKGGGRAAE